MKKNVLFFSLNVIIVFGLLIGFNTRILAQAVTPFGCNANFYATYNSIADPTDPTSIDKVNYNGISIADTFQATANGYGFDAADINPIDGFMYGVTFTNYFDVDLLKIDKTGNVNVVGTLPSFVGGAQGVFAACFDYNGDFYVTSTPSPGESPSLYKVSTTDASAVLVGSTGAVPDDPTGQLFFVDISIDPTTGIMYGASNYCCGETGSASEALYTINKTTGAAMEVGQFTTSSGYQVTGYGLFCSDNGDLFLYGTDANFYLVNKSTAAITQVGSGHSYAFADGCGCGFRVDNSLATSTPAICLTDSTSTTNVSFTETFLNNRGEVVTGAGYHLALDKRFQFTQTAAQIIDTLTTLGIATGSTVVNITSDSGGTNNVIDISPINIPYNGPGTKTSFVLSTLFTNLSGPPIISTASEIYNLPAIIGGEVLSDNPATAIIGDSTQISICNGGSLPVTFISFNAAQQSSGNILVEWQVAQEINIKNYVVERSYDGVNFTDIGTVSATGASTYSFVDNTSLNNGKVYYRVVSVDITGKLSYTPTVLLNGDQQLAVTVTPNPFKDDMQLQIVSTKQQPVMVKIFGADGKLYQAYNLNVNKGASVNVLQTASSLPAGVYALFVNMVNTGEVYSQKVIKE